MAGKARGCRSRKGFRVGETESLKNVFQNAPVRIERSRYRTSSEQTVSVNLDKSYHAETPSLRIADGRITVKKGFVWKFWSVELHTTLVFLGFVRLGLPAPGFRYGVPWSFHASLVCAGLVSDRAHHSISRSQVRQIYISLLKEVNFPLAQCFGFFAGAFLPLSGWND